MKNTISKNLLKKRENQLHDAIEGIEIGQNPRNYIGYSGIGGDCKRAMWYNYRNVAVRKIPLRVQRLFDRGTNEEPIIIRDLESAGITVTDQQKEVINQTFPQLKGHIDGIAHDVLDFPPVLLEMKTANHSRFEKIKKQGIKSFDNAYWVQMNGYMKELGLKACLYIVTNKNNDERLYRFYGLDTECLSDLKYIIPDILDSNTIPPKIGGDTWYKCKFCDYFEVCHRGLPIDENCRNCSVGVLTDENGVGVDCDLCRDENSTYDGKKCSSYIELEVL